MAEIKKKTKEKSPFPQSGTKQLKASEDKRSKKAEVEKRKVKAHYTDANSSPQKMRLVANLIRGKSGDEAINILKFTNKKAAVTLLKLLNSVISNADNQYDLGAEKLIVSSIDVGDGIKLPRYRFASRGRISRLSKRRSLINIEMTEK